MIHVSRRILIVDDEENLTWSLARNLKRSFDTFEILSTTSGKEAYQILKSKELDLLITDIKIPDMSGLTLLSFVQKNKPDMKVILMTSFSNSNYRDLADGIRVRFLEKPFEIEDLKNQIQSILQLGNETLETAPSHHTLIAEIKKLYHLKYNGWLRVQNGNSRGELYFENGVIMDAIVNQLAGEMALIHVLNWKNVEIAEKFIEPKPKRKTIYYGWEMLKKELLAA